MSRCCGETFEVVINYISIQNSIDLICSNLAGKFYSRLNVCMKIQLKWQLTILVRYNFSSRFRLRHRFEIFRIFTIIHKLDVSNTSSIALFVFLSENLRKARKWVYLLLVLLSSSSSSSLYLFIQFAARWVSSERVLEAAAAAATLSLFFSQRHCAAAASFF